MSRSVVNAKAERAFERMTNFRWVVLGFIFVIYTVATADRSNIGLALPFIRKQFPMSNTEAGALMSLFFVGYVVSMLPGGFLCSKLGVRRLFSIFMVLTSVFTGLIGFAGSPFQRKALRLGVGLSEGPMAVGLPTTINNWFPAKEKGFATGIFMAASKFGPLMVPPVCGLIVSYWGWRQIFWSFAIPGIVFSVIWYFLVANQPADSRFCSSAEAEYIRTEKTVIKGKTKEAKPYGLWWVDKIVRARKIGQIDTTAGLFRSWNMIGSALGYFFVVSINTTMMSWIPTYLITVKKFAIMKMAFAAAAPFAGAVVGNMVGGWLSDNVFGKRRKPMMIVTALTTAGTMYSLIYSPQKVFLLACLLFVLGFFLALGFSAFVVYPMGLVNESKVPDRHRHNQRRGPVGGILRSAHSRDHSG